MDARATLVADGQPAEAMEPGHGALDDPAGAAEAAAMFGAPPGELGPNASPVQHVAVRLGVIGAVALDERGFPRGAAPSTAHGWNRVDQGQELGNVVAVGGRQRRDERNPVRVGENMMLRPGFAAIGRVRSSFFPPRSARSEELSTTARARSSSPRRWSSASRTACSRFQTPARCHRTKRRQQVLPEPQPISRGNMFQGRPLRSTNRMPVKTARSDRGFRPAYRRFRGRRFGSSGSISAHRSSSIANVAMRDSLLSCHATVPSRCKKYKF
jgi:hypothetical protein